MLATTPVHVPTITPGRQVKDEYMETINRLAARSRSDVSPLEKSASPQSPATLRTGSSADTSGTPKSPVAEKLATRLAATGTNVLTDAEITDLITLQVQSEDNDLTQPQNNTNELLHSEDAFLPTADAHTHETPAGKLVSALFDVIDADGSGYMESVEARMFLCAAGCEESELDYYWQDILRTADSNQDGKISKAEFLAYILGDEELDASGAFIDKAREAELADAMRNLYGVTSVSGNGAASEQAPALGVAAELVSEHGQSTNLDDLSPLPPPLLDDDGYSPTPPPLTDDEFVDSSPLPEGIPPQLPDADGGDDDQPPALGA